MSQFDQAFTSLLGALTDADVQFVVIGGWALPVHGVVRTTEDVDIVPSPARSNLERLAAALRELEAHVPGADPALGDPLSVSALSGGSTVRCMTRVGDLHIVQGQTGIPPYDELRERSLELEVESVSFRVCSYEDLVAMKLATGRAQDEIDVNDLRRARGEID